MADLKQYRKIIFVGENGTCRSAMAEAIFREYRLNRPMEVSSRARVALFPEPINQKAEAVLIGNGIHVGGFMSSQLLEGDFAPDTLIVVMEEAQRQKILQDYKAATEDGVWELTQLVGDELEIINPYGGTLQAYGICYETLNKSIKKLIDILNADEIGS